MIDDDRKILRHSILAEKDELERHPEAKILIEKISRAFTAYGIPCSTGWIPEDSLFILALDKERAAEKAGPGTMILNPMMEKDLSFLRNEMFPQVKETTLGTFSRTNMAPDAENDIMFSTCRFWDDIVTRSPSRCISISLWPPKNAPNTPRMPILAPTKEILLNYKNGKGTQEEKERVYEKAFRNMLARLDVNTVYAQLQKAAGGRNDFVLMCFEKEGDFCHRFIVADWLRKSLTAQREGRPKERRDEKKEKAFSFDRSGR